MWGSAKNDAEETKEDAKSAGRSFWGSAKDGADDVKEDAKDTYGRAKSRSAPLSGLVQHLSANGGRKPNI